MLLLSTLLKKRKYLNNILKFEKNSNEIKLNDKIKFEINFKTKSEQK